MLHVQLDVNWIHNPKVARAGLDGAGLHAHVMCLAKSLQTDGWIDTYILSRFGATDELIERLVDLELLEREGTRVRPNGWHDRNPTQAALDKKQASKSEGGKRGNHKRWHSGPYDECPECHGPSDPQVIAGSDRERSVLLSHPSPESETCAAIAGAIDRPDPGAYRLSEQEAEEFRRGIELVRDQTGLSRKATA